MTDTIFHALVLNLHQPAGNLESLLTHQPWQTKEILYALDRIPRALWSPYDDLGRVHVSLSGTLLETLADPEFQRRVYGWVKCGDLLWYLQNSKIIEILGTGYYHPVLPLMPNADWEQHLSRWQGLAAHLFSRAHFAGFWPPEMGFTLELIPYLKRLGYRYVIVDSEHVVAKRPMSWQQLRYRPHIARYGDDELIIIVRDRELSNAQESGMSPQWFIEEVTARTRGCAVPPLVTTCTDGDNGGWFRNATGSNFWQAFYQPLLQQRQHQDTAIRPCFIHEYLDRYGVEGEVLVRTGAWNTGDHSGIGFVQWTGSQAQKDALQRVKETSAHFHALRSQIQPNNSESLETAHWHLLRAQTSCYFYWGEAWLPRCHQELDIVWQHLNEIQAF
ncbi:MAG: glycoside hydrolase family 57 [Pseudomonadota bacterium]|nr:glycoside hydrolase family 57 [Pseudomonadota bacterium]